MSATPTIVSQLLLLSILLASPNLAEAAKKEVEEDEEIAAPNPSSEEPPPRSIQAVRTSTPIKVDGKDDDAVWRIAPKQSDFTERKPLLGAKPPLKTEVQVAYDDKALYVFLRAETNQKARVLTLRRDNFGIFADDTITVKIDPFRDRRTAMMFSSNTAGAQADMMGLDDGRRAVGAWDTVWEAKSEVKDNYFTLEYRIPFSVLGVKEAKEALTMGLNISRDDPHRNATYDWRLIVPPRPPFAASTFGTVEGIQGLERYSTLEFTPFVLARTSFQSPSEKPFSLAPGKDPNLTGGMDVRAQVGTSSYLEASVLTDFAHVEADQIQVAGNRFPLFFPERRPFFLNGLDIFNFGVPQQNQLFFSRRIGLQDGRTIPIAAGVKSYGHSHGLSYGFLHVQTLASPADVDQDIARLPPESFTVARMRAPMGRHLTFGLIGLGRHRFEQRYNDAFSGGFDAELRSADSKLRGYGFLGMSWFQTPIEPNADEDSAFEAMEQLDLGLPLRNTPSNNELASEDRGTALPNSDPTHRDQAGATAHASVQYRGLYVRPGLSWTWSDKNFEAPMGFYRRPHTAEHNAQIMFVPRPQVLDLQTISFGPTAGITTDDDYSELLTRNVGGQLAFNWNQGWGLNYNTHAFADEVRNEFTLYGHTVNARRYFGQVHRIEARTPRSGPPVSGALQYRWREAFGGSEHQIRADIIARLGRHLNIGGSYIHRVGHLEDPNNDFNFGFANGNVDIAFHPNLIWDTLVRYNLAPGSEQFGIQSRLRWRYRPGSDLFLVYRTAIDLIPEDDSPKPFHQLTAKATFYLRKVR